MKKMKSKKHLAITVLVLSALLFSCNNKNATRNELFNDPAFKAAAKKAEELETELIPTDNMGAMIPEKFREVFDASRPALIVFSMGTTFKGGVDDQQAINKIVEEMNPPAVYRHVDAALFGGYLAFSDYNSMIDKKVCGYDSIAISGHKYFGIDGLRNQTNQILENTTYLKSKLDEIGWPAWITCKESNTVFFKKPNDDIMKKHFLAPDYDEAFGGDLAHVVVMQNVSKKLIDEFINELSSSK